MVLVSPASSAFAKVVIALFTLTKLPPVPALILDEKSLIQFRSEKLSPLCSKMKRRVALIQQAFGKLLM